MESSRKKRLFALAAIAVVTGVVALVVDMEDEENLRPFKNLKVRKEDLPFMMNNPIYDRHREPPEGDLPTRIKIEDLFADPNRNYVHVFTSLFGWEFFSLADHLRPFIETSRSDSSKPMGDRMKKDYRSRLYYTLYWLVTKMEYRQMEFYFGWSKSQFGLDIPHVLKAIIAGLDAYVRWPSAAERAEMAQQHSGIFKDCVGIIDANEVVVNKSKNKDQEASTFSGKCVCMCDVCVFVCVNLCYSHIQIRRQARCKHQQTPGYH
jgi:hypothetical protein